MSSVMWICTKCKEQSEEQFESCWTCGKERIDLSNKNKAQNKDDIGQKTEQSIEKERIENRNYINYKQIVKRYVRNVILFYGSIPIGLLVLFLSLYISSITFLFGFIISLLLLFKKYTFARLLDNRIEFLNALDDKYKSDNPPNNLSDYKIYDSSKTDFDNGFTIDGNQKDITAPLIYYSNDQIILYAENTWVTLSKGVVEVGRPSTYAIIAQKLEIRINQLIYTILVNSESVANELYNSLKNDNKHSNSNKNDYENAFATNSPVEEIKKYKELLDSGAITQEEYDAKKKELLDL